MEVRICRDYRFVQMVLQNVTVFENIQIRNSYLHGQSLNKNS